MNNYTCTSCGSIAVFPLQADTITKTCSCSAQPTSWQLGKVKITKPTTKAGTNPVPEVKQVPGANKQVAPTTFNPSAPTTVVQPNTPATSTLLAPQ